MKLSAKTGVALTITALSLVVTVGADAVRPRRSQRKEAHSSTSSSFPHIRPTST